MCRHNQGEDLQSSNIGLFFTRDTAFDVRVGKQYRVFGMGVFRNGLVVLVRDETGKPNWLPVDLFEIAPQPLPAHWQFALFAPAAAGGWRARWGYDQLLSGDHIDRLIERDPAALNIFEQEASHVD